MSSIFAGCAIFAVIGYMAHMLNVEVKEVAADGRFLFPPRAPRVPGSIGVPEI